MSGIGAERYGKLKSPIVRFSCKPIMGDQYTERIRGQPVCFRIKFW